MPASLYRRLLGPDFDRLPPVLRRFHDSGKEAVGSGSVDIQVGQRPWTRLLARALRLPAAGRGVPVTVRVYPDGERERWSRTFGATGLQTVQWVEQGRLRERVGALTFSFDVSADETGMRFRFAGMAAFGMKLPRRFAVHVDADVTGFHADWHVNVTIRTPGSRLVMSYDGRIAPVCPT